MKLTEQLIEEYIDNAKLIIDNCYSLFVPPTIVKITITKARSYWAQIKYVRKNCYELRVSNVFNEIKNEQSFHNRLMSCMIHELIHTLPECWNHGKSFKTIANIVNKYHPEFNIQTATIVKDVDIKESVLIIRYVVKCNNCGAESKYTRKPKIWQFLETDSIPYYCRCCGKSEFTGIKF